MMKDAKFYVARRDTRWDPYPARHAEVAVAHDWHGFWQYDPKVGWFRSPVSFHFVRSITRAEAEAFENRDAFAVAS